MKEFYGKKVVLVTGANRGLGLEIVKRFNRNNYIVIGGIRNEAPLPCEAIQLDLRDTEQIERVIQYIIDKYGRIDVLINNAGIYIDDPRRVCRDISDLELEELEETLKVNYFGCYYIIKKIVPLQIQNFFGRIINISSGMGRINDFDEFSYAYRSSKLLLNTLTICYGKYFSKIQKDIAISSVCPGWIRTSMGTNLAPELPDKAADFIVKLVNCEKKNINGKFFRNGEELDWTTKE